MIQLVIFLGVPLSGKTTLATIIAEKEKLIFISLDNIRLSLYGYLSGPQDWIDEKAKAVQAEETKRAYDLLFLRAKDFLKNGFSVIIEMVHLGSRELELLAFVHEHNIKLKIIWCYISKDTAEEIKDRADKRTGCFDVAPIRPEDYRMFQARNLKPTQLQFLELDTSQAQDMCLEKINQYIADPL